MDKVKVYVITDREVIDFLVNDDINGFKEYLIGADSIEFNEPETFESETEALAFCAGLGYCVDERAPIDVYPLRSFEPVDKPFITLLQQRL